MMTKRYIYSMLFCAVVGFGPVYAQDEQVKDSVEKIAIPYGQQTKYRLAESLSTADSEDIRKASNSSLTNSLVGLLPGLTTMQTSGETGANSPTLYIRGNASLHDNTVLVLVDGIECAYDQITWSEVDKVTLLKDASALAIYGQRGANGVLLITTKRGYVSDKPVVTFNAQYGGQQAVTLPSFAGLDDYVVLYNEARANDGLSQYFSDDVLNGYANNLDPYLYPNVNWYDNMLNPISQQMQYDLTFRGGNNVVKYFLMLGVNNEQGLYAGLDPTHTINSNLNNTRYSVRSNIDVNVTSMFTVSLDVSARLFNKYQPNVETSTLWKSMSLYTPFPAKTPTGEWASKSGSVTNPEAAMHMAGYQSYHSRELSESLLLRHKLDFVTKGLAVFAKASFSSWFKTNYNKTREYATYEISLASGTPGVDPVYDYMMRGKDGDFTISQKSYWQWNRMNVEAGFDYDRSFGAHDISALLMYYQDLYRTNGERTAFAQQRILGRVNYTYDDRYIAEFTASYSGSDNFAPGKKFGFFPAGALGWVISNEEFLKDNKVLSFLKLKASTGLSGNDRLAGLSRFGYDQYWTTGSGITVGGETTSNLGSMVEGMLANPNLTWEKSFLSNVSIEAQLWNRLSLGLDLFYEDRYDILVSAEGIYPSYIGASLPYTNDGEVVNRGAEFQIQWNDKIGKVEYFLGGNIAFARNKVINKNEEPRANDYRWETGHPVGTPFGLICLGFYTEADFDEQGNLLEGQPIPLFGDVQPGDLKYQDLNGDNYIDELDMTKVGLPSLPELNYAFTYGVSYAGFDFSMLWQGVGRRSVYLTGNAVVPFLDNARISNWAATGRWTPENADNATFPRLTTLSSDNNYRTSTFWMRDGSFLRLRNVELGYSFPYRWIKGAKLTKLRLYLNGTNLFTFQKMNDVDMDVEMMTINNYPITKSYNVGLKIEF